MADVEYDAISKFYGAVEVMRDLSLSIPHGRFVVLLGASGCGKTTLLRMTAGLETITAGELRIGGLRMNEVHPRDRNIAMVFQNYALYPTMKVFDNIAFSLQIKRLPAAEVRARVLRAAEMLNLTPFLDRYPRELSGGQRQRVAMGRAMVRDADVFLFDEPLSNLDAKLRAQMRVEIRRLHDKLGATTIYVTHDQIEAMTMADTIVLMRGGRIEQVGTPDELYDRPASLFAADFIGTPSMNFISGQVGGEEGRSVFESPTFRLPLSPDMSVRPGQKVICGIRPADVSLDPDGPIEGELVIAEKTGADLHLHLSIADHDFIATTSREVSFTTGTRLRLAVPPDKVHLFDAATEIRI